MGDIAALTLFLLVSIMAWKLKDVLKTRMPLTLAGLILTCFVTNSTVLLPSSSMLVVLEYSFVLSPLWVVFAGAIGASLGELTGYMVGAEGHMIIKRFHKVIRFTRFRKHPFLWVMAFAFIPVPVFDIAGIIAGSIQMNPVKFLTASILGKFAKMGFFVWITHILCSVFG